MFDSDKNERKKKLKENMSKIREMIGGEDIEKPDKLDLESRPEPERTEEDIKPPRKRSKRKRSKRMPDIPEPEDVSGRKKESKSEKRKGGKMEGIKPVSEEERPEIPEPPKIKELSVPDIEKGPLFITKKKFFEANNRVNEMKGISSELESQLDELRNTLNKDEKVSSSLEDFLTDVEEDIARLRDIVSP